MQIETPLAASAELTNIKQQLTAALRDATPDVATPVAAGLAAYEQARLDGLCHDGAWECALDAARRALANQQR